MKKIFQENINKEKNILLDNTNPSKDKREFYISLAKKNDYTLYSLFFDFDVEFTLHLNYLRNFSIFKN